MLTMHLYPGGCSYKNPGKGKLPKDMIKQDAAASRDLILSPQMLGRYDGARKAVATSAQAHGLAHKLGESNSFWFGGLEGASNTYASALWGLDFLWWWVFTAVQGSIFTPVIWSLAVSQLNMRSLSVLRKDATPIPGYGLKAFSFGSEGSVIPVTVSVPANLNLTAYAAIDDSKKLTVTVINKEHVVGAQEAKVTLHLVAPATIMDAKMLLLEDRRVT